MVDHLRTHDAAAGKPESAWRVVRPVAVVLKALALGGVAIGIGVSISHLLVDENAFPPVAVIGGK
jgi:hypothetical protein